MKLREVTVPDVLISESGEKIINAEQWKVERRAEILEQFKEHVYGRTPVGCPEKLTFEAAETLGMMEGKAERKLVKLVYEGPGGKGTINLVLFIPVDAPRPVPAFLLINNRSAENIDPDREILSDFWPAEDIISRGYAAAAFSVSDVDPDTYDDFKDGVHGIFDPAETKRQSNAWGTISAWAWGASRVMDYFEADTDIDTKRVAVVGHSRGGKTALWCGAQDERFAMVVSNNSGCTGAAITRGKQGENVRKINDQFPHWFCENYKRYNDKEEELPVDQHMLLAMIAPRLLYVTSATEDLWADPESEFLSCVFAEPVYNLFGMKGLGIREFPEPEAPVFGDHMAYHLRTGGHGLTGYDWKCFMEFADQYFK